MSIIIEFLGTEKLQTRLSKLTDTGPIRNAVEASAIKLQSYIQEQKLTGGDPLNVRSGRLRRSITYRIESDAAGIHGIVGTNVEYARIQEYGGTITPKNAKYLTIPFPAALTPSGVMRYPGARDYPNTFIRTPKGGGNPIIFQKNGEDIIPLFLLKKSVTLPERSYLRSSLEEQRSAVVARLQAAIHEAMA